MYVIKHLYIIKHLRWSVFAKIVNCLNLLTIFEKKLHLGCLIGSSYATDKQLYVM